MKKKYIVILAICLGIFLLLISGFIIKNRVKNQVNELFTLNKVLQEEGYLMTSFEFIMVDIIGMLDKGNYLQALSNISDYHEKLSNKEGLILLPDFKTNQEEINFFLNLQNPETGAFAETGASFDICWSVTENTLIHIEALQDSITKPLKLKYPLRFLDEIATIEKLYAHLEELSYVGWLAPKFPQTSFVYARGLMSCARKDNVLSRNKLYEFSPEWKNALLKWMYDFQDPETGMWGPRFKSNNKLAVKDMDNTTLMLKQYLVKDKGNRYEEFPLQYRDKLFASLLKGLKEPFPEDDNLSEIHAWNLKVAKGIKTILIYLWKDASDSEKQEARLAIENIIKIQFDKYYVEKEGAFSYYPYSDIASCDGMTNFSFKNIGALSYEKQKKFWGEPTSDTKNLEHFIVSQQQNKTAFEFAKNIEEVNSIRIYTTKPDFQNLMRSVWAVHYPHKTKVLDAVEVIPNVLDWAEHTDQSMGNWKSAAEIKDEYFHMHVSKPIILDEVNAHNQLIELLKKQKKVYMVGFDVLQVPRFQCTVSLK